MGFLENQRVREAVKNMYEVFSAYPLRPDMERCRHCVTDVEVERLCLSPLRMLSDLELRRYVGKAMSTWGDDRDFRHFLPRVLELLAANQLVMDWEQVFAELTDGDWQQWPEQEQKAIREYFLALWQTVLTWEPSRLESEGLEIGDVLCAIGQPVDELSVFLEVWRDDTSMSSRRHFASFVISNTTSLLRKGKLSSTYWDERSAQMNQVIEWMLDPSAKSFLEDAFSKYSSESFASELSFAARLLDLRFDRVP